MTRPRTRTALAVVLATLAGTLTACGYTTKRLEAFPSARTVAVVPFRSPGYRRDLDLRLTQAVVAEVRARTRYALSTPTRADLVIEGIVNPAESVVLQRTDRQVVEQRLHGTLQITIRDRRSGRVVKQYEVFDVSDFTPDRFGESLEGSATDAWVRRLATRVVQGLEAPL